MSRNDWIKLDYKRHVFLIFYPYPLKYFIILPLICVQYYHHHPSPKWHPKNNNIFTRIVFFKLWIKVLFNLHQKIHFNKHFINYFLLKPHYIWCIQIKANLKIYLYHTQGCVLKVSENLLLKYKLSKKVIKLKVCKILISLLI